MINKKEYTCRGSLTVEASLITWPFVLFILSFLYLIHIFTIQEHIQSSITRMGLDLAQMSYIFDDFNFSEEAEGAESLVGDIASEIGLSELIASSINSGMLKLYSSKYIDKMRLDSSSIVK